MALQIEGLEICDLKGELLEMRRKAHNPKPVDYQPGFACQWCMSHSASVAASSKQGCMRCRRMWPTKESKLAILPYSTQLYFAFGCKLALSETYMNFSVHSLKMDSIHLNTTCVPPRYPKGMLWSHAQHLYSSHHKHAVFDQICPAIPLMP